MRKLIVVLCLTACLPISAMAAKRMTVAQLSEQLADLYQNRKTDDSIAIWLKDVELTEQLTAPAMNKLFASKPGPLTIGQLLLLYVESSLLLPPPSDLPSQPPLDQDAQTALLHRAQNYVAEDVAHLPRLTAQKQTLRFHNSINYVRNDSGNGSAFGDPSHLRQTPESFYLTLQGQQAEPVTSEGGIELQLTPAKKKVPGPNSQSFDGTPGLPIGAVLADAAKGSISWLRWETVNGRQTAVFSFSVAQKDSHYKVNYCCFPSIEHIGSGMHFSSNTGFLSTFTPFTASPGYHGELFIDPATGIIVRLITKADLKPTDFVVQEDIRVDYSAVPVADKKYVVPTQSMILTTVTPNGDSYVHFDKRRILFDVNYSKFQLGPAQSHSN